MSQWKLERLNYDKSVYDLHNGECSIGRRPNSTIPLCSAIVSREHCFIYVDQDTVEILDPMSSNGTYIDNVRIPHNDMITLKESTIIGIGWAEERQDTSFVAEQDKFIFKLVKVPHNICKAITILDSDDTESNNKELKSKLTELSTNANDLNESSNQREILFKSKIHQETVSSASAVAPKRLHDDIEIINILSDCEEDISYEPSNAKKIKLDNENGRCAKKSTVDEDLLYEEFINIKHEFDDEPIKIDSDDDSCDADLWLSRLSQSQCIEVDDKVAVRHIKAEPVVTENEEEEYPQDIIILPIKPLEPNDFIYRDTVDGKVRDALPKQDLQTVKKNDPRKCLLIDPVVKRKGESKRKSKNTSTSTHKNKIKEQNEERKKRLYEIATKNKTEKPEQNNTTVCITEDLSKPKINAKVTATNRGAFLIESAAVQPTTKHTKTKKSHKPTSTAPKPKSDEIRNRDNIENINSKTHLKESLTKNSSEVLKTDKPVSKAQPTVAKKKSVRFSSTGPEVRVFQIEPGNKLINLKYAKPNLEYNIAFANCQTDLKPLDRQYIMKILKWNTNWLSEKNSINKKQLPDLTGENVTPTHLFHSFQHHFEYIKQIGHLLLIDIWESLSHNKSNGIHQDNMQEMRIDSVSPQNKPSDSYVTICVNMSKSNIRNIPRQRDIIILTLRPGVSKFFYVHDITNSNVNNFVSIHLHSRQSDKLHNLQRGDIVHATNLINMNSYMILFQAMQCLATSPLCEIILRPKPQHFTQLNMGTDALCSKWTMSLNDSQLKAVESTVAAALSEEPSIQMIQGPPGTGKSSVICSIVMTYFYGTDGRRLRDRGKILICATSNAAVDELVIRLLNIRQNLPHDERFRMVRVGRDEAMHERARHVSLKTLTERTVTQPRHTADNLRRDTHLTAEMMHLEAKENMWRSALDNTADPSRQAYCKSRLEPIVLKRRQLQNTMETGSCHRSPSSVEQDVVQKADIIATTLTSVANHRVQWLKGMVTLCIVDEAGQAIEPVTLIPLTLGVKRLALIGDPQQLPGFTKSQYAKELGLGVSLFSRLSSCGEEGSGAGPAVLLNKQYRMHAHIADYPNRAFYGGQIENMAAARSDLPVPPYSMVFISNSGHRYGAQQTMNEREAWGVARLVTSLYAMAQEKKVSLAVITPYVAQREIIKKYLRTLMATTGDEPPVEVNTVDSFQGQERDVVVVSIARRHGVGFLHDAGRMNVMLTRAKHSLLICLDPNALQDNEQWRTLIEDAKKRKLYKYLPEHFCWPTTAENASREDVLKYLNK